MNEETKQKIEEELKESIEATKQEVETEIERVKEEDKKNNVDPTKTLQKVKEIKKDGVNSVRRLKAAAKKRIEKEDDIIYSDSKEDEAQDKQKGLKIYDAGQVLVREYSLKVHGENYKQLAEQFAKKKGYKII